MGLLDQLVGTDTARAWRANRRRWTAGRAQEIRPSEAIVGKPARVTGTIAPAGDLVRAPFTQRSAVACFVRLEVKTIVSRDGGAFSITGPGTDITTWREEIREASQVPFFVTDEMGGRLLVSTTSALWVVDPDIVNEDPHVNDENHALCTFLRSRGIVPTAYMGIAGDTRFYERAIVTGERVSVYGDVDETQEVHAEGYRDAPERIVRINGSPDAPVIVFA